jgi:hypothetical protein
MRRTRFVLVALSAIVGLTQVAATAGPAHSTQKRSYSAQGFNAPMSMVSCSGQDVAVGTGGGLGVENPQVRFRTQPVYRTVSLRIADQSATKVWAVAWQGQRTVGVFCGKTSKPLAIRGSKPVTVALFDAVTDRGFSIVTHGTVTATFAG